MVVTKIEFPVSEELATELEVWNSSEDLTLNSTEFSRIEDYLSNYRQQMNGLELIDQFSKLNGSLRILDIGVGMGHSSFQLISMGHQVSVVDPSMKCCTTIKSLAENWHNQNMKAVYCCIGETLDKLPERNFDVCLFSSSLHHCDDPVLSLKHCYNLLKPGGKLIVMDENILKFYRSKEWFYRQMRDNPELVAHYGGNEHVYRIHEYRDMILEAGFNPVLESVPKMYQEPLSAIRMKLNATINGKPAFGETHIFTRLGFYIIIKKILKFNWMTTLLKRLSLINITFVATKPQN